MRPDDLYALLERVAAGKTSVADASRALEQLPFEDLGFAKIDHHRALRTGQPEVVYGAGKTVEQVAKIVEAIAKRGQLALVTRIEAERAEAVKVLLPAAIEPFAQVEAVPRLLVVGAAPPIVGRGTVAVVCAGTADLPVAEEAARTLEVFGNRVERVTDVGVAGLHRLISHRTVLESAEVIVVVAGMEGALPSVVAGMVSRPVIGVPTSVGFGTSFGGVAALLSMLNACAAGITVVNIDNGFGAGYAASVINAPKKEVASE